jgi:protein-S-isoprenylcysteine O-methyltransferase Ste14
MSDPYSGWMSAEGLTPYFVGRPLAAIFFFGGLALWIVIEFRQAANRRADATRADRGSGLVIRLCALLGFVLGAQAADRLRSAAIPAGAVTLGIGLLVTWAGIGLRWMCFRALGSYFTVSVMTSPNQRVITSGPYRVVRHPSYMGLLLVLSGIAIVAYANWISLASVILLSLAGLVYRIRVEEAALSSALGEAYASYAAGRKRLIPFVW